MGGFGRKNKNYLYLLTGGSGVLGSALQDTAPSYDLEYLAPSRKEFDITSTELPLLLSNVYYKLSGIIHCAAYTNVPGAETPDGKRDAINTNIIGTKNISDWAKKYNLPLVYISTDYVYPGIKGFYKETDRTAPVNYYACTKLMGEAFIDISSDLIIRTSFKPNLPWPYPKAFDDLYCSADYVDIIAKKISFLLYHLNNSNLNGIINVGTERKSIYELAKRRNKNIKPMSKKDIKDVNLPDDISLDTTKYNKLYSLLTGEQNVR